MIVLILAVVLIILTIGIIEIITACGLGSLIPEKDISDYLDKIEKENLIDGVSKRWNDKFTLNVKGYTHTHLGNPSIHQTQYSLIFPYYIYDVGVIPIWSKSYLRIKNLFRENIENSPYKITKRDKLGLN